MPDENLFPMSDADRARMRRELVTKEKEYEDLNAQRESLKDSVKEVTGEMKKLRKVIVTLVNALDEDK